MVVEGWGCPNGLVVADRTAKARWWPATGRGKTCKRAFGSLGDSRMAVELLLSKVEFLNLYVVGVVGCLDRELLGLSLESLDIHQDFSLLRLPGGSQGCPILLPALMRLVILCGGHEEVVALRVEFLQTCGDALAFLLETCVLRLSG